MMSDPVVISLIAAVGALASTVLGVVNNAMARKNDSRNSRLESHIQETKAAVSVIQKQTNGMTTRLAQVTGEKEFAKGQHEGEALVRGAREEGFGLGVTQGHRDRDRDR